MTTESSSSEPSALRPASLLTIYVLNAGYGESIVVHLPGGTWGVVDCYASNRDDPASNPTLQLLEELQVRELEFLCLTHPHADHFYGMSQLLQRYPTIRLFWRFPPLADTDLILLMQGKAQEEQDAERTKEALELRAIFAEVNKRRRRRGANKLRLKHGQLRTELYPSGEQVDLTSDVSIMALAPCADRVEAYKDTLRRCFDTQGRLLADPPSLKENDLSLGLLIRYGTTRVVLGGDVEKPSWEELLRDWPMERRGDLAVHGVKVSHHGSTNGYCINLWETFSANGQPVAVVTPSSPHRLPKAAALTHIRRHARSISFTSLPAAATILGLPELVREYGLEAGAALAGELSDPVFRVSPRLGCCIFTFDNSGNVVDVSHRGAAGFLPAIE
jgi:beta-lactamase superfamily II metal-dependent hydrolase